MSILVTGAAGFIGFSVSLELLKREEYVVGVDNLNDYYDVSLKKSRIAQLNQNGRFSFRQLDISDFDALNKFSQKFGPFRRVIHLAAQAGVRNSSSKPFVYIKDNITGHLNVLEICRQTKNFEKLVFASSSAVYGGNSNTPLSISDDITRPISLYAASKAADELISYSYTQLYDLPQVALRYSTVYGPWGRPDMAIFLFTDAILNNRPIRLFNFGNMSRDFVFIDDIVDGTLRALTLPQKQNNDSNNFKVYNLGSGRSESIQKVVLIIEKLLAKEAIIKLEPIQPGDPKESLLCINSTIDELGYQPEVSIQNGISKFIEWYRNYYKC